MSRRGARHPLPGLGRVLDPTRSVYGDADSGGRVRPQQWLGQRVGAAKLAGVGRREQQRPAQCGAAFARVAQPLRRDAHENHAPFVRVGRAIHGDVEGGRGRSLGGVDGPDQLALGGVDVGGLAGEEQGFEERLGLVALDREQEPVGRRGAEAAYQGQVAHDRLRVGEGELADEGANLEDLAHVAEFAEAVEADQVVEIGALLLEGRHS